MTYTSKSSAENASEFDLCDPAKLLSRGRTCNPSYTASHEKRAHMMRTRPVWTTIQLNNASMLQVARDELLSTADCVLLCDTQPLQKSRLIERSSWHLSLSSRLSPFVLNGVKVYRAKGHPGIGERLSSNLPVFMNFH